MPPQLSGSIEKGVRGPFLLLFLKGIGGGVAAVLLLLLIVHLTFSYGSNTDGTWIVIFLGLIGFPTNILFLVLILVIESKTEILISQYFPLPYMPNIAARGWLGSEFYVAFVAGAFVNGFAISLTCFGRRAYRAYQYAMQAKPK